MDAVYQIVEFATLDALSRDSIVQINRDLRWIEHPGTFAIKLERSTDAHGHNGSADLLGHDERALLERTNFPIQSSSPFRENDHTNPILDMRANLLQGLLELRGASPPAHRDIPKTFH